MPIQITHTRMPYLYLRQHNPSDHTYTHALHFTHTCISSHSQFSVHTPTDENKQSADMNVNSHHTI